MSLKAILFRILVLPDVVETEKEVKTDSGLIVKLRLATDQKMEQMAQVTGTILDIGEDAFAAFKPKTDLAGLKVGDKIWFAKYAGKWIKDTENNREVLCINDEDIVCKEI